ncbi:hypothetical protein MATL_G00024610 [Megalops atlanticus]|uniref:Uncharacterized protein n=1 Tax=Megalops atlanticus TaxID=7932 RepID=A0A9D3TBI1_MEGAT|nr:hypothetical protein MATL_G00024610 [Megalops atlanticus]
MSHLTFSSIRGDPGADELPARTLLELHPPGVLRAYGYRLHSAPLCLCAVLSSTLTHINQLWTEARQPYNPRHIRAEHQTTPRLCAQWEGASGAGLKGNAHYLWISASTPAQAEPLRTGVMGIVRVEIRGPEQEVSFRMQMVQKSH